MKCHKRECCIPESQAFGPSVAKTLKDELRKAKEIRTVSIPQLFLTSGLQASALTSLNGDSTNIGGIGQSAFRVSGSLPVAAGQLYTLPANFYSLPVTLANDSTLTDLAVSVRLSDTVPVYAGSTGDAIGVLFVSVWESGSPTSDTYAKVGAVAITVFSPISTTNILAGSSKPGSSLERGHRVFATAQWKPTSPAAGNLDSALLVDGISVGITIV